MSLLRRVGVERICYQKLASTKFSQMVKEKKKTFSFSSQNFPSQHVHLKDAQEEFVKKCFQEK